ncbi:DUF2933 domain-containing protein [Nodosilinea sp. LEGE 06152]|uniref:DUF2933 domain-containing protein n=1 Tax=Nodosilinea sp. LEGE 06152 TaxID=2777966 RepID=UPI0018801E70|nr:DUF2933 domain-containing protein [Nodosilinea sp. LEGE 06152]MBE9156440.1 DUF2933 domain-containing protein [Nodosilinea sp. LEGE 06152]
MKTKFNVFGMCFDWRVLVGLVAIGIAIAILVPQLTLSALPLLLLAACPLSMFLMMAMMNRMDKDSMSATSHQSVSSLPTSIHLDRDAQLAQLREHLQQLQTQHEAIAHQINTLEQSEQRSSGSSSLKADYHSKE